MKQSAKLTLVLILLLTSMLLPTATFAQSELRMYLSGEQLDLQVGQQATVEVRVEGADAVYGTEFHLLFDPEQLEIVKTSHGDFLSTDPDNEAFVLQNEFDNELGTIDYAVSLLNPAPPVNGNGVLFRFTVRAKTEGPTMIEFIDGLFGTQAGEELVPFMENIELVIAPGASQGRQNEQNQVAPEQVQRNPVTVHPVEQRTFFRSEENGSSSGSTILGFSLVFGGMVIGFIGFVLFAGLIGIWFWKSRSR